MDYKSFEELAKEQGVKPITNLSEIMGGWPEGEDFEEFLASLQTSRHDPTGEIATLTERLAGIEQAVLRLYRARVARRETHAALKAYRQEHGSCVKHGNLPPCFATGSYILVDWCEICQGAQPLWEARRKAYIEATAALISLLNMGKVLKRKGEGIMTDSYSYIALKDCGCLAMAMVDNPEHKRDVAKEIAKGIRQGYSFSRLTTQQVREMPWTCPEHQKEPGV